MSCCSYLVSLFTLTWFPETRLTSQSRKRIKCQLLDLQLATILCPVHRYFLFLVPAYPSTNDQTLIREVCLISEKNEGNLIRAERSTMSTQLGTAPSPGRIEAKLESWMDSYGPRVRDVGLGVI